jgi:hypothetical protein
MINTNKDIAEKTERKLLEQNQEFNILRDRCLVVSGFSIAMTTAFFTFWSNIKAPYNHALIALILIAMIGVAIMIYSASSNPLNRGMNVAKIRELIENEEDYFLNEIAFNLDSFNDNIKPLQNLQFKLNLGLIINSVVIFLGSLCIYFNQISHG